LRVSSENAVLYQGWLRDATWRLKVAGALFFHVF